MQIHVPTVRKQNSNVDLIPLLPSAQLPPEEGAEPESITVLLNYCAELRSITE